MEQNDINKKNAGVGTSQTGQTVQNQPQTQPAQAQLEQAAAQQNSVPQNTAQTQVQTQNQNQIQPQTIQGNGNTYTLPIRQNVEPTITREAPEITPLNKVDASAYEQSLRQLTDAAARQNANRIDYTVTQKTKELNRAMQDADPMYRAQQSLIDIDEKRSLDNQALYAEARGDRGGVGREQYNSIQNTAAVNRLNVQQQQTKLATDTARQITDLRAQGEFEKADGLLSLTQNFLSQLMSLRQWADQLNLSVDETNMAIQKWKAEYEQNAAQYLDTWKKNQADTAYNDSMNAISLQMQMDRQGIEDQRYEEEKEYNRAWQKEVQRLQQQQIAVENARAERQDAYNSGYKLLSAGIMPNAAQLSAMGITSAQAQDYINSAKEAAAGTIKTAQDYNDAVKKLYEDAAASNNAPNFIENFYKSYGLDSVKGLVDGYDDYAAGLKTDDQNSKKEILFNDAATKTSGRESDVQNFLEANAENYGIEDDYADDLKGEYRDWYESVVDRTASPEKAQTKTVVEKIFNPVIGGRVNVGGNYYSWEELGKLVDSGTVEEIPHRTGTSIFYEYRMKK